MVVGMSEPADDPDQKGPSLENAARIAGLQLDSKDERDLFRARARYIEFSERVWALVDRFRTAVDEPARTAADKEQKRRDAKHFARIHKKIQTVLSELDDEDFNEELLGMMEIIGIQTQHISDLVWEMGLLSKAARYSESKARAESGKESGRPSQSALDQFVFHMALFYAVRSKKMFTFQRVKDSEGCYLAITPGHQFVTCIVEWMTEPDEQPHRKISNSALATACERAVTHLREL